MNMSMNDMICAKCTLVIIRAGAAGWSGGEKQCRRGKGRGPLQFFYLALNKPDNKTHCI